MQILAIPKPIWFGVANDRRSNLRFRFTNITWNEAEAKTSLEVFLKGRRIAQRFETNAFPSVRLAGAVRFRGSQDVFIHATADANLLEVTTVWLLIAKTNRLVRLSADLQGCDTSRLAQGILKESSLGRWIFGNADTSTKARTFERTWAFDPRLRRFSAGPWLRKAGARPF